MQNTLTFPDIVKELSAICKCSEAEAQAFVSAFCEEIAAGVASDGMVRIKGLGTFRALETAEGKTVGFVPERKVADMVNAPFAMFEPVELSGDIDEEQFVAVYSETTERTSAEAHEEELPPVTAADAGSEDLAAEEESPSKIRLPEGIPQIPSENQQGQSAGQTVEEQEPDHTADVPAPEAETPVVSEPMPAPEPAETVDSVSEPVPESPVADEPQYRADYRNEYSHLPLREVDDGFVAPRESDKDVKIIVHRPRWGTLAIVFAIALLLGILIGYFGFPWINLHEVKNVKITADNVCVTQQPAVVVEEIDSLAGNVDSVNLAKDEPEKLAPTKENEKAIASSQVKAKVVTDTVKGNNYLSRIARRHYGKDVFWVYIYEENIDKIQDPDNIPAGTVVVIPPPEKYNIDANNPESVRAAERKRYIILTGN